MLTLRKLNDVRVINLISLTKAGLMGAITATMLLLCDEVTLNGISSWERVALVIALLLLYHIKLRIQSIVSFSVIPLVKWKNKLSQLYSISFHSLLLSQNDCIFSDLGSICVRWIESGGLLSFACICVMLLFRILLSAQIFDAPSLRSVIQSSKVWNSLAKYSLYPYTADIIIFFY